ncbi:MAG: flippase-like domain-containing protein [Bacteroidales bacterium]|nr:flippase-like domain-containing protein [Bacteroidales bacterium]
MNKKLKNILKIIIFFSVGIGIFIWVSKDQDWEKTKIALLKADYTWIVISLILGLLSHLSRAIRWNILIKPLGFKPRTINSFFSVMIMYLSNMAIPRSGEVVRCGVMSKTEKIPFTKLLGTVFIERVIDFIMLFILLAIVLLSQMKVIINLFSNSEFESKIEGILSSVPFLVIFAGFFILIFVLLFVYRTKIKKLKIYKKIRHIFSQFAEGIKTILKMERKFEFIFHSVFIWGMYFLMIYIIFWSFDFTENLTVTAGLTVFVMSAFGMVFPSPGGIGSWHIAVIETLFVFGVSKSDGYVFALATHGSMTIMMIIVGVASIILLPIVNKEKKVSL